MIVPRLVVDGMNVIGSRPDGWWRDRPGAVRRLLGRLSRLAEDGQDVTLVLDGEPIPGLAEGDHGGVEVRWAQRRGRDAADDRIVRLVAEAATPGHLRVVSADRALRDRVTALGAAVEGPAALLDRLDRLDREVGESR